MNKQSPVPNKATLRVLITGGSGFTGQYINAALQPYGLEPVHSDLNLKNEASIVKSVKSTDFEYVLHLAAVSHTEHNDPADVYAVNTVGSDLLLKTIATHKPNVRKVVLASSSSVYGSVEGRDLDENQPFAPKSHYSCSKVAMEYIARNYNLPIVVARPFNYTGRGQSDAFLVPKIVNAFINNKRTISLGNTNSVRCFTDVRYVAKAYARLLVSGKVGNSYNICSDDRLSVDDILDKLAKMCGYQIEVSTDPKFVRKNDIKQLTGSNAKLKSEFPELQSISFDDTLRWMLEKDC